MTTQNITILSSADPFSFCLQSLPASGSFPMSQLFGSGGQSIGASATASVFPMNNSRLISCRIDWFDPLQSKGLLGQVECMLQARLRQSLLRIDEAGSHSFSGKKVTL